MTRILVENTEGCLLSYEINLDDPVSALKADIEETEGIPTGEN